MCKSEEGHGEDHDKESKDDEESEEKLSVHVLHEKQAASGQWQKPF